MTMKKRFTVKTLDTQHDREVRPLVIIEEFLILHLMYISLFMKSSKDIKVSFCFEFVKYSIFRTYLPFMNYGYLINDNAFLLFFIYI